MAIQKVCIYNINVLSLKSYLPIHNYNHKPQLATCYLYYEDKFLSVCQVTFQFILYTCLLIRMSHGFQGVHFNDFIAVQSHEVIWPIKLLKFYFSRGTLFVNTQITDMTLQIYFFNLLFQAPFKASSCTTSAWTL